MTLWDGTVSHGFAGGNGTQTDPYRIANASQLAYLAELVNASDGSEPIFCRLTSSMDLNGWEWTPIGCSSESPFAGRLDGGGYTISGLAVCASDRAYAGLFGYVGEGSVVENVNLVDLYMEISASNEVYAGGIAGWSEGTILNCTVEGRISVVTADMPYRVSVGGLTGWLNGGAVESCLANCELAASSKDVFVYVGGLAGSVTENGVISASSAAGTASASVTGIGGIAFIGGVCGELSQGLIRDCLAVGDVTASGMIAFAGGLVGESFGEIRDSYRFAGQCVTVNGAVGGNEIGSVRAVF
jgi:hypothetical protein